MRFGYWTPIFGSWLRNVPDPEPEQFSDLVALAQKAEEVGFELTLIPELHLNDIRGVHGPVRDAWAVTAALAAVTSKLEIMTALRPSFHPPELTARKLTTIQEIAQGRLSLNIVSAWWQEEARQFGAEFKAHDDRYAVTEEYVSVLQGLWRESPFTHSGAHYSIDGTIVEPKPLAEPVIYAGGESPAGRASISRFADAYVTHGGTPEELRVKIADLTARREAAGRAPFTEFGMATYVIVRDTEDEAQAELARITDVSEGAAYDSYQQFIQKSSLDVAIDLKDYSVSNRGLRPNLVGTPQQVADRIREFEDAGVDLLLIQAHPMIDEVERIGNDVIPLLG
ncbi:LLM class flavin-dependent oxidoreductase [Humidisolicoccus flavus]|uniref:LLM class flavin-dependent oxidoreductase n=1 Tax=Humidisolicoccus flavus TaxID=3111414 RepID=UPI0032544F02